MRKTPKTNFEKIADLLTQIKKIRKYISDTDFFNAHTCLSYAFEEIFELRQVITDAALLEELNQCNTELIELRRQLKVLKYEFKADNKTIGE